MKKQLGWLAICTLSCLVLYFSWLKEPSFSNQSYMPEWLIGWTDTYGRLRTAVPFFLLGLVGFLFNKNRYKAFVLFISYSFILVLIAETGQLFLPYRFPDWADVLLGTLGGVFGFWVHWLYEQLKKAYEQKA